MTATLPTLPSGRPLTSDESRWSDELGQVLRPTCFPARQDDLLAVLIRHHAPSHLMWRLTCLPRTRQFTSLEEVVDFVDGHATTGTVSEPL
jgi:hypothetical protein